MRLAEDRMAAPGAVVRTAARGDHRDRAHAVMLAPDAQVPVDVDGFAIGPRLSIEILDQGGGAGLRDRAVAGAEENSRNGRPVRRVHAGSQQRFECDFTFAGDDDVSAGGEVFRSIIGGLRTAENHAPSGGAGPRHNAEHAGSSEEVSIYSDHSGLALVENSGELLAR